MAIAHNQREVKVEEQFVRARFPDLFRNEKIVGASFQARPAETPDMVVFLVETVEE